MRVGLFITCLTDTFYPRVGVAVVKTLRHLGCEVEFPEAQTCCGQPGYNSGLKTEAGHLIARMAEVFAPYDYVVSPSGSCVAMVKLHGPHLFTDAPSQEKAQQLADKTHEFGSFLSDVLRVDWDELGVECSGSFTYHYPCHLRGLVHQQDASEVAQGLGSEFVPMERFDTCCGFGGTFASSYPEISGAMLADKLRCIENTGAETVICNEGGCGMNIGGGLHRSGSRVRLRHLAEIIAEAKGWELPQAED